MPRVRRSAYVFYYAQDGTFVDLPSLLRGRVDVVPVHQLVALSVLTAEAHVVTSDDVDTLVALPSGEWTETPLEPALRRLAEHGLVVTDDPDTRLVELRRREERLLADEWHPVAALFHFMTRWRDVDVERLAGGAVEDSLPTELDLEAVFERVGKPPNHFHRLDAPLATLELPAPRRQGAFYDVLRARRTTRAFDTATPLPAGALSTLLYETFGCHGISRIAADVATIKKTSPSGGGLHPVEAYPLVRDVEGVTPGLYHYDVGAHRLELAVGLGSEEAAGWAREFTAGQSYFASAHVLVVLAARFWRSFWKYRRHQRAYAVLLMDAAHLSQTLYLVAAELGLGAFVTAAINGANIDERLGLDGFGESALAVCGCGVRAAGANPLDPVFEPFSPF